MTPVALAIGWCSAIEGNAALRRAALRIVGSHAVLAILAHVLLLGPWVFGNDRFRRIGGAQDLANQIEQIRAREKCDAVVAGGYQLAALLTYYTPGHPPTYMPPSNPPKHQFAFWPGYQDHPSLQRVLYVAKSDQIPDELRRDFRVVQPIGWIQPKYRGRPMRPHHVSVLADFRSRRLPADRGATEGDSHRSARDPHAAQGCGGTGTQRV